MPVCYTERTGLWNGGDHYPCHTHKRHTQYGTYIRADAKEEILGFVSEHDEADDDADEIQQGFHGLGVWPILTPPFLELATGQLPGTTAR